MMKKDRSWITAIKTACVCEGIMIIGYFLNTFAVNGQYENAALVLPYDILQGIISVVLGTLVLKFLVGKSYETEAGSFSSTKTRRNLK